MSVPGHVPTTLDPRVSAPGPLCFIRATTVWQASPVVTGVLPATVTAPSTRDNGPMNGQNVTQPPEITELEWVTVRFWAAARAATGVETTSVAAGGLSRVIEALARKYPELSALLPRCSLLLDGVAILREDVASTLAPGGATLEILPPFAGG